MLPLFLLLKNMGLINTYWGVIIPGMASIFGIFLVRQYALPFRMRCWMPRASTAPIEFRIFRSIVVPAIMPILATLAIWTFLATWNDFMWPLIVLSDESHYTLPVRLANLSGEHVQDTELMMAGSVITVIPVCSSSFSSSGTTSRESWRGASRGKPVVSNFERLSSLTAPRGRRG